MNRRSFIQLAVAMGATVAWGSAKDLPSHIAWRERRDLFPEGVASGDPDSNSVLLWTRCPNIDSVQLEVAEDREFHTVVAAAKAAVSADADWTCRVLAAGLKPSRVYWYRFTDKDGN